MSPARPPPPSDLPPESQPEPQPEPRPDLRQRRRLRTMDAIRKVAIDLALTRGLDDITTEMIAEAAGISPRTFFNYFTYKEEALIRPPLGFPARETARFIEGQGPMLEDLLELFGCRLAEIQSDRDHIRNILGLATRHPRLQAVQERTFSCYGAEIRDVIGKRLGLPADHETPVLMAAVIGAAFRVAVHRWIAGEDDLFADHLRCSVIALSGLFDEV